MTNSAPVNPNELANRIRAQWERGLGCYDAAFDVLHAAWRNGEIQPGPGPTVVDRETPNDLHSPAPRAGRLRLLPAALFAIGIILVAPVILWVIGYGLLPAYAWGLSWAR